MPDPIEIALQYGIAGLSLYIMYMVVKYFIKVAVQPLRDEVKALRDEIRELRIAIQNNRITMAQLNAKISTLNKTMEAIDQ